MTEFKVRLRLTENDCYTEVWQVVGEKKYFARHTYGVPVWYFVCDPFGYCELDRPCPDSYIFVVCDQGGNPLFRDGNGDEFRNSFLSLEQETNKVWQSVKEQFPTRDGLNDWLLSYMTPENLAKDPVETQFCPADNWTTFWHKRTEHKAVYEYIYLGTHYAIWAVTCKHRYCDCIWTEYMAGEKEMDWEYPYFVKYFGASFDPVYGPMYSKRQAIQLVKDALNDIYRNPAHLSLVTEYSHGAYERRMSLREAAERLLGGNLRREAVDEVILREYQKPSMYKDSKSIKADYPDYKPDYSLDWMRWY